MVVPGVSFLLHMRRPTGATEKDLDHLPVLVLPICKHWSAILVICNQFALKQ